LRKNKKAQTVLNGTFWAFFCVKWWTIKQALQKVLCESQSYDSHRISAKLFLYFMTEIGLFFSVLLIFP